MKKRDLFFLIFLILLTILMRFAFVGEYSLGEDSPFHYSIVEQSLEKGYPSSDNNLVNCLEGVKNYHPLGYYLFHYYPAKLIGLNNAFKIIPIIFAIFNILLAFYLISYLFNKRIAFISVFLIAVSIANISKSASQTFRGENLIYPFLLLSLIFALKFLEEKTPRKKFFFSILAGFFSGISSFVWSGYVIIIIILTISICLYLLYNLIKNKTNEGNLKFVAIAFFIQFVLVKLLTNSFMRPDRNSFAGSYYLFLIIIPLAVYLIILKIFEKPIKHKTPILFIILILGAVLISVQESFRNLILKNLRIVNQASIFVSIEARPTSFLNYFFYYGFVLITSILGIIIFFKNFNRKKIFFLGLLIPSIILLVNAMRFIYFASIPLLILSAIFLDWFLDKGEKRKKKISHLSIFIIFMMLVLASNLFIGYFYMKPITLDSDLIKATDYIKENAQEDSCFITSIGLRGFIPYLTQRSTYLAWPDNEKDKRFIHFLFTNSSPDFNITNSYFLIRERDIYYQINKVDYYNLTGIDASLFLESISNTTKGDYIETTYKDRYDNSLFLTREYKDRDRIDAYGLEPNPITKELAYHPIKDTYKGSSHYTFFGKANPRCFYIGNYSAMYLNQKLCNSNIFKILTWQDIPSLEKFYRNNRIRIYKILAG